VDARHRAACVSQKRFRAAKRIICWSDSKSIARSHLWREAPLPDHAFEVCAELAHRYAARLGVRTLDTMHVASALELKAEQFWTFDGRQAKLAVATGLKTD